MTITRGHTGSYVLKRRIHFLVKRGAGIISVFLSNPGHRWFRYCIFHPCVMFLSGWVITFFSPPTPPGNGGREDGERSNSVVRRPESCSNYHGWTVSIYRLRRRENQLHILYFRLLYEMICMRPSPHAAAACLCVCILWGNQYFFLLLRLLATAFFFSRLSPACSLPLSSNPPACCLT